MPKVVKDSKTQKKNTIEKNENLFTSENIFSNDFSEALNKLEIQDNISNEFVYFTPISFEKKVYFPPTPKKQEKDENLYFVVKGRNLSELFANI